jgi:hypothetical protein
MVSPEFAWVKPKNLCRPRFFQKPLILPVFSSHQFSGVLKSDFCGGLFSQTREDTFAESSHHSVVFIKAARVDIRPKNKPFREILKKLFPFANQ